MRDSSDVLERKERLVADGKDLLARVIDQQEPNSRLTNALLLSLLQHNQCKRIPRRPENLLEGNNIEFDLDVHINTLQG